MKRLFLFFVLITTVVFNYSCKEGKEAKAMQETTTGTSIIELITPQEMQDILKMEGAQLIDVRTPEEYKEGYIEGFQNIDYYSESFMQDIEKLDKSKPVVVYCKSGHRSGNCAKKMQEAGFSKIYDLDGGITKWKFEGFEVKEILN